MGQTAREMMRNGKNKEGRGGRTRQDTNRHACLGEPTGAEETVGCEGGTKQAALTDNPGNTHRSWLPKIGPAPVYRSRKTCVSAWTS